MNTALAYFRRWHHQLVEDLKHPLSATHADVTVSYNGRDHVMCSCGKVFHTDYSPAELQRLLRSLDHVEETKILTAKKMGSISLTE